MTKLLTKSTRLPAIFLLLLLSATKAFALASPAVEWQKLANSGARLLCEGKLDDAEKRIRKAFKEAKSFQDTDSRKVASYDLVSRLLLARGDYHKSRRWSEKSMRYKLRYLGASAPELAQSLQNLARAELALGQTDSAMKNLEKAKTIISKGAAASSNLLADVECSIASQYLRVGDLERALSILRRASAYLEGSGQPAEKALKNEIACSMALGMATSGDLEGAGKIAERCMNRTLNELGSRPIAAARHLDTLARASLVRGDTRKAISNAVKCWELRRRILGHDHPQVAESMLTCGLVYLQHDEFSRAESCFTACINIAQKTLSTRHPLVCNGYIGNAFALLAQDKANQAIQMFETGIGLYSTIAGIENETIAVYKLLFAQELSSQKARSEKGSLRISQYLKRLQSIAMKRRQMSSLDLFGHLLVAAADLEHKKAKQVDTDPLMAALKFLSIVILLIGAAIIIPGAISYMMPYWRDRSRTDDTEDAEKESEEQSPPKPMPTNSHLRLKAQSDHIPNWSHNKLAAMQSSDSAPSDHCESEQL